jgi:cellobiose-specific phosphotransferase system component IIC
LSSYLKALVSLNATSCFLFTIYLFVCLLWTAGIGSDSVVGTVIEFVADLSGLFFTLSSADYSIESSGS